MQPTAWNRVAGALERHFAAPCPSSELAEAIDLAEESIVGAELRERAEEIESLDRRLERIAREARQ